MTGLTFLPPYRGWEFETGNLSQGNTIEQQLLSHIHVNWSGRFLISYNMLVNLIGANKTAPGAFREPKGSNMALRNACAIALRRRVNEDCNVSIMRFEGWSVQFSMRARHLVALGAV